MFATVKELFSAFLEGGLESDESDAGTPRVAPAATTTTPEPEPLMPSGGVTTHAHPPPHARSHDKNVNGNDAPAPRGASGDRIPALAKAMAPQIPPPPHPTPPRPKTAEAGGVVSMSSSQVPLPAGSTTANTTRLQRTPSGPRLRTGSGVRVPSHPGRILKVVKGGASPVPADMRYHTSAPETLPPAGTRLVPGGAGSWVPPGCGCWLDKSRVIKPIRRKHGKSGRDVPALPRTVLRPCEMHVLIDALPMHLRWHKWSLLFSTDEHGSSPETMRREVQGRTDVLMVVHTTRGEVLGAFLPTMPDWAHPGRFAGSGETFVYAFRHKNGVEPGGELAAYHWVPPATPPCEVFGPMLTSIGSLEKSSVNSPPNGGGSANPSFSPEGTTRHSSAPTGGGSTGADTNPPAAATPAPLQHKDSFSSSVLTFNEPLYNHCFALVMQDQSLAVGGGADGAALIIDHDLKTGRTSQCATFASPALLPAATGQHTPERLVLRAQKEKMTPPLPPPPSPGADAPRPMTAWGARPSGRRGPPQGTPGGATVREGELFISADVERHEPLSFMVTTPCDVSPTASPLTDASWGGQHRPFFCGGDRGGVDLNACGKGLGNGYAVAREVSNGSSKVLYASSDDAEDGGAAVHDSPYNTTLPQGEGDHVMVHSPTASSASPCSPDPPQQLCGRDAAAVVDGAAAAAVPCSLRPALSWENSDAGPTPSPERARDAKFTIAHLEFWTFDDARASDEQLALDSPLHLLSPCADAHTSLGAGGGGARAMGEANGGTSPPGSPSGAFRGDTDCTAHLQDNEHHLCLV